jgi:hypothetical protein
MISPLPFLQTATAKEMLGQMETSKFTLYQPDCGRVQLEVKLNAKFPKEIGDFSSFLFGTSNAVFIGFGMQSSKTT